MGGLHRSKRNKIILGVCGGLAEYFRVDPVLIRIICVVISFSGFGILLYLAAALIMPEDREYENNNWSGAGYTGSSYSGGGSDAGTGEQTGSEFENDFSYSSDNWDRPPKYESGKNKLILGAVLIGLGVILLAKKIMPGLFDLKFTVPLLLIVIGGIIVYRGRK